MFERARCLRAGGDMRGMDSDMRSDGRSSRIAMVLAVLACLLLIGVVAASAADAGYEWLGGVRGKFAPKGTESQLGVESAAAVNDTSGDVYMADGQDHRVTRFSSNGEFLEAWGWEVAKAPPGGGFQRCGKDGESGYQTCALHGEGAFLVGEGDGVFEQPDGIAVDQSTGDVYVLDPFRHKGVVQVFSPDGEFITGFIESASPSGIAVDSSGNVYLSEGARVKVFRPEAPGDYAHYIYTGESHDIVVSESVSGVGVDSSGDVYVVAGFAHIDRFAPVDLDTLTWGASPECESKLYGQISGLTVNPSNADIFTYSFGTKRFYRLSSVMCATEKTFTQLEEFKPAAGGGEVLRLALSPAVGLEAEGGGLRPSGTLYVPDPVLSIGTIFGQSPVFPPKIVSESTSNVGAGYGTIGALIDPHGNVTHYVFQYATVNTAQCSVAHECNEVPAGGGDLEASEANLTAAATVSLQPDTTYHFRILASSHCNPAEPAEVCESIGEDHVFMTFSTEAGAPPDGRGYELVSPPLKDGGEVFPPDPFVVNCKECLPGIDVEHFPMQSSPDGNAIVYEGQAFSPTGDAVKEDEYLAIRTADGGWGPESSHLSPALEGSGEAQGYKAVSPDLAHAVLYQVRSSLAPDALESNGVPYVNLYLQDIKIPSKFVPLLTPVSVSVTLHRESGRGANALAVRFAGASSDLSHVVFEANDALTLDAQEGSNLYEWVNGGLRLVNILPNETSEAGAVIGAGTEYGTPDPDYSHAVSRDGARIFWTATNGHVYVRENNETVKVPDPGKFLTASADGARVLLNDGKLYGLESEELTDLTEGQGGFQGILGTSEDLSKVYFVDTADLTGEEENAEKVKAKAGGFNLYVWREGVTVFIATLGGVDNATNIGGLVSDTGDWFGSPSDRTAQASPDGRYLAFMAKESLTGYDNEVTSGDCGTGLGSDCFEVFTYDASANQLSCASCDPTGEHPLGSSMLGVIAPGSGSQAQPASVSTSGRVFFDSLDTLSPQDKNNGVQDIYEFEPDGVGTCAHAGGCVFLISSGTGETDASFVNATPSGGDVFFTARSQLVPQDQDDLIDLYDAREPHVPGEQVSFPLAPPAPECSSGDECRGSSSSSPPDLSTPLSANLSGSGNLVPASPAANPRPPALTRSQLLAKALRVCQKQKTKKKRAACAIQAKKRYGVKTKTKTTKTGSRKPRTATK